MTEEPQVCLLRTWYCYRTAHVEECNSLRRSNPRSLAGPDQNQKLGRKIQGVRCRRDRRAEATDRPDPDSRRAKVKAKPKGKVQTLATCVICDL